MGVSQSHARRGDDFTVHAELEVAWLLEGRVLRADRDDKSIASNYAGFRYWGRATALDRFGLLQREIGAQREDVGGPIVGDKETVIALRACDLEAKHLV